jgi:hypothetical protein
MNDMTPAAIIASAWASEREKHTVWTASFGAQTQLTCFGAGVVFEGDPDACQAHLDQLCAAAVERALAEAGYVIVPRESGR